jgi:hypothetical protein
LIYLIIGSIISLAGVGFMLLKISIIGIILLIVGVFVGLKGRKELDKREK